MLTRSAQPVCQSVVGRALKSARHQPGGVQPCRTAPINAWLVAYVSQVKAWNTMHVLCVNRERFSGSRRNKSVDHFGRQIRPAG
jgi:hypothetical protein